MLVDTGQPFLQEAIASKTTRKNFLIFSVYQTELWFPPPLPSYHFSTVGFLNKLYIYEALESQNNEHIVNAIVKAQQTLKVFKERLTR